MEELVDYSDHLEGKLVCLPSEYLESGDTIGRKDVDAI
jgi:hypothetical protein